MQMALSLREIVSNSKRKHYGRLQGYSEQGDKGKTLQCRCAMREIFEARKGEICGCHAIVPYIGIGKDDKGMRKSNP